MHASSSTNKAYSPVSSADIDDSLHAGSDIEMQSTELAEISPFTYDSRFNGTICVQLDATISNAVNCTRDLTQTPKEILDKIFNLQSFHIDPIDIESAANRILEFVADSFSQQYREYKYDCLILYRTETDFHIAERSF